MSDNKIFVNEKEINRLKSQNTLLAPFEQEELMAFIKNKKNLKVLDIGCNNGYKTVERFSNENISKVIGLEFHNYIVENAREKYGNEKFSFYNCDVQAIDFEDNLKNIMVQDSVKSFDIIYLSFVLIHLNEPEILLNKLKKFLSHDGCIFVVEANDSKNYLKPDSNNLLKTFFQYLPLDVYGGNRNLIGDLPNILDNCGYKDITEKDVYICGKNEDLKRKEKIVEVFLSYFPEDVKTLKKISSDFSKADAWLSENYDNLISEIYSNKTTIAMCISFISCKGDG